MKGGKIGEKNAFIPNFVNISLSFLLSDADTGTLKQNDRSPSQAGDVTVLLPSATGFCGAWCVLNHKPCKKSVAQPAMGDRFTWRAPGSLGG